MKAIESHELGVVGEGGSSIWLRAPEGVDMQKVARSLYEESVLIEAGHPFFAGADKPKNFYRLAYSSIAAERIPEGIAKLAAALRREAAS